MFFQDFENCKSVLRLFIIPHRFDFWGALHWRAKPVSHQIRGSIVVSISACHAEDPGSIPGRGVFLCRTYCACDAVILIVTIVIVIICTTKGRAACSSPVSGADIALHISISLLKASCLVFCRYGRAPRRCGGANTKETRQIIHHADVAVVASAAAFPLKRNCDTPSVPDLTGRLTGRASVV